MNSRARFDRVILPPPFPVISVYTELTECLVLHEYPKSLKRIARRVLGGYRPSMVLGYASIHTNRGCPILAAVFSARVGILTLSSQRGGVGCATEGPVCFSLFWKKVASHEERDSLHARTSRAWSACCIDGLGLILHREIKAGSRKRTQLLESFVLLFPIEKVAGRHRVSAPVNLRPNHHQPFRVGIRQPAGCPILAAVFAARVGRGELPELLGSGLGAGLLQLRFRQLVADENFAQDDRVFGECPHIGGHDISMTKALMGLGYNVW